MYLAPDIDAMDDASECRKPLAIARCRSAPSHIE
jgi:hypothetical protein